MVPPRLKPTLVHGRMVPEITDSFSPKAIEFVGNMVMDGLSCPFTWNTQVLTEEEIKVAIDRLCILPSEWERMILKCRLAFSLSAWHLHEESSVYIAECFMPILEVSGLETDEILPRVYRKAWRYILDATSAFIRRPICNDYMIRKDLYDFVKTIPNIESLHSSQRAAILAIRSQFTSYPENEMWIREALKLNREEGMWHFYLSRIMFEALMQGITTENGKSRAETVNDILLHNSYALQLRPEHPEPYIAMGHLLMDLTAKHRFKKAYVCVKKAIKQFPDNAWVYEKSAELLQYNPPSCNHVPKTFLLIDPFYKKALKLAKKECLQVKHKLGFFQVMFSQFNIDGYDSMHCEGLQNLTDASTLNDRAKSHLKAALEGKIDVSDPLSRPHDEDEGDSSCDEPLDEMWVNLITTRSLKTNKKSNKN